MHSWFPTKLEKENPCLLIIGLSLSAITLFQWVVELALQQARTQYPSEEADALSGGLLTTSGSCRSPHGDAFTTLQNLSVNFDPHVKPLKRPGNKLVGMQT